MDKSDKNWEDTCLRAVEFFSQVWGGAYNIIVPTDGKTIDERFWTILEAFDPDNVYFYRKSGEDIRLSSPEEFQGLLDSHVSSWVTQFGDQGIEHAKERIEKDLRGAWASDFSITFGLQDEIKVRLSPFYFQEWTVEPLGVSARSGVPFALTSLAKIIRNAEHPDRFATVNAPADLVPRLWYSAACGLFRDKAVEELEAVGLTQDRFDFEDADIGQLIEFVVNDEIQGPWVIHPNMRIFTELNGIAPFQLSMLQLGLYRPAKYPGWAEPMVLVAGGTVDDFCLYYCLSRLRERVRWVLPSATEKALSSAPAPASRCEVSFINQLHNQKFSQQSQGEVAVTSFSLADAEVEVVMAWLNTSPFGQMQIAKAKEIKHLVRMPLVAIERDNFRRDIPLQLSDDLTISPFNTPKPKNFRFIDPREHRYIAQLSVARESPPKHFHLGKWVIPDRRLETKQARVGKDGPAYFCPNTMYFGGDIDTVLVRPHLRLPPLQKILVELARTQGYDCRPSDKGIYADETIAKWGGLDQVSQFLQDVANRSLLDMFLDRSESGEGRGVYLDDRRRYLDFPAITTQVGKRAAKLIDQLISKQILYRGFIFLCQYCRNSAWFSISEISQEFRCRRCGRSQVYTKTHWKIPDEPAWFYKLDELVYQGYRQGMVVSLLALNYLNLESTENFSFVTDREFWKPEATKAEAEIDLFCVSDGVLTIGEAKKENRLGASTSEENAAITKYKRMAAGLSARRLILATFGESWSPITIERVASAFSDMPQVAVQYLNAAHLHLS